MSTSSSSRGAAPLVDTTQNPAASKQIQPLWPAGTGQRGRILWWNDSPYGHYVSFNSGGTDSNPLYVPAFHGRLITPAAPVQTIYYSVPSSATLATNNGTLIGSVTPISKLIIEYYPLGGLPGVPDTLFALSNRMATVPNTPGVTVTTANQWGNTNDGLNMVATSGLNTTLAEQPYSSTPNANRNIAVYVMRNAVNQLAMIVGATAGKADTQFYDSVHVAGAFDTDGAKIATDGVGDFMTIAGQALAGFGVPLMVIAPTKSAAITVTTAVTLFTFTPTADGFYRVTCALRINNGTPPNVCDLHVAYTSPLDGAAHKAQFGGQAGTSAAWSVIDASLPNVVFALAPLTFYAAANQPITLVYQDPTNTPNDTVVYMLERLS